MNKKDSLQLSKDYLFKHIKHKVFHGAVICNYENGSKSVHAYLTNAIDKDTALKQAKEQFYLQKENLAELELDIHEIPLKEILDIITK